MYVSLSLITVQHFSPPSVYITEGEITTPRRGNAYTHYLLHTVWSSVLVYLIRASLYEAVPLASGIHLLIVIRIILRTLRPVLPRLFGKIIATFQLLLPHTDKILMHACLHCSVCTGSALEEIWLYFGACYSTLIKITMHD